VPFRDILQKVDLKCRSTRQPNGVRDENSVYCRPGNQIMPNHRAHHSLLFLDAFGVHVDIISLKPFYDSARRADPWTRFWRGLSDSISNSMRYIRRKAVFKYAYTCSPVGSTPSYKRCGPICTWAHLLAKSTMFAFLGIPIMFAAPHPEEKSVWLELSFTMIGIIIRVLTASWLWNHLTRYREHL